MDVKLGKNLAIPNIDLITILANAYENAIYGCMEVKKQSPDRDCFIQIVIKKKKNKLVIYGEYDFKNDNGVFVFRLIMNIPRDKDSQAG